MRHTWQTKLDRDVTLPGVMLTGRCTRCGARKCGHGGSFVYWLRTGQYWGDRAPKCRQTIEEPK